MRYTSPHGSETEGFGRAVRVQRQPDDVLRLPTSVSEQRRLPGLPPGSVLPGGYRVPQVRQAVEVPRDQGSLRVLLPVLWTSRLPHGRHDLPQVHRELAALVLGGLPNQFDPRGDQREAARTRDRRLEQDGAPDVPPDSRAHDGAGRPALG